MEICDDCTFTLRNRDILVACAFDDCEWNCCLRHYDGSKSTLLWKKHIPTYYLIVSVKLNVMPDLNWGIDCYRDSSLVSNNARESLIGNYPRGLYKFGSVSALTVRYRFFSSFLGRDICLHWVKRAELPSIDNLNIHLVPHRPQHAQPPSNHI